MKQLEEQILVSCVCCFVKNIIPMRILSIAGNTLTTNMHGLLKVKYNMYVILCTILHTHTKDEWYNESLLNLKNSKVANTYVYWEGEFWPNG